MTIAYVGGGGHPAQSSARSDVILNPPTGVAEGDLLIAWVMPGTGLSVSIASTGWTLLRAVGQMRVYTKTATASEPTYYQWTLNGSGYSTGLLGVYRGASKIKSDAGQSGSGSSLTAPGLTAAAGDLWLAAFASLSASGYTNVNIFTGVTEEFDAGTYGAAAAFGDKAITAAGPTGTATAGNAGNGAWAGHSLLLTTNSPPNAPILAAPANNATIDRNSVQRFALTPSDPDPGDSTSQTWWRYRLIGAPAWTTVTQTSPLTYIDFAAGTFAAGDYEWQAATRDAQGAPANDADLKWSTSSFFTAADAPAAPTITAPINGATVTSTADVAWSAPSQGSYQLRRVRDNAGTADPTTVYYDSGEVVSTTARSRSVTFETNNRYEHVQVRIKVGGLWSSWASVRVNVSYTPPTVPVVTLTPDAATGSLLVGITNPAPGAGVPATSYNDVYVDDGDGEERRATMLAPNSTWTYWTPISGRDYDGKVRVVAVGSNGTTASS